MLGVFLILFCKKSDPVSFCHDTARLKGQCKSGAAKAIPRHQEGNPTVRFWGLKSAAGTADLNGGRR